MKLRPVPTTSCDLCIALSKGIEEDTITRKVTDRVTDRHIDRRTDRGTHRPTDEQTDNRLTLVRN